MISNAPLNQSNLLLACNLPDIELVYPLNIIYEDKEAKLYHIDLSQEKRDFGQFAQRILTSLTLDEAIPPEFNFLKIDKKTGRITILNSKPELSFHQLINHFINNAKESTIGEIASLFDEMDLMFFKFNTDTSTDNTIDNTIDNITNFSIDYWQKSVCKLIKTSLGAIKRDDSNTLLIDKLSVLQLLKLGKTLTDPLFCQLLPIGKTTQSTCNQFIKDITSLFPKDKAHLENSLAWAQEVLVYINCLGLDRIKALTYISFIINLPNTQEDQLIIHLFALLNSLYKMKKSNTDTRRQMTNKFNTLNCFLDIAINLFQTIGLEASKKNGLLNLIYLLPEAILRERGPREVIRITLSLLQQMYSLIQAYNKLISEIPDRKEIYMQHRILCHAHQTEIQQFSQFVIFRMTELPTNKQNMINQINLWQDRFNQDQKTLSILKETETKKIKTEVKHVLQNLVQTIADNDYYDNYGQPMPSLEELLGEKFYVELKLTSQEHDPDLKPTLSELISVNTSCGFYKTHNHDQQTVAELKLGQGFATI